MGFPAMVLPMKAMKAMKAVKAMKAMKGMKAMKKSKVGSRVSVFRGGKEKTVGGLKKSDLVKNSIGKIVSKKASAASKKTYAKTIKAWIEAVSKARKELGLKGFVALKKSG